MMSQLVILIYSKLFYSITSTPHRRSEDEIRQDRALVAERLRLYRQLSLPEVIEERREMDRAELAALSDRWRSAVAAAEARLAAGKRNKH